VTKLKMAVPLRALFTLGSLASVGVAPRIHFDKESLDYGRVLFGDTPFEEFAVSILGGSGET
jgi:hypothetical protein